MKKPKPGLTPLGSRALDISAPNVVGVVAPLRDFHEVVAAYFWDMRERRVWIPFVQSNVFDDRSFIPIDCVVPELHAIGGIGFVLIIRGDADLCRS